MEKFALITGGSRGIGRATAVLFARKGINVAVNYLNNDKAAKETIKMLEEFKVKAFMVKADVSVEDEVRRMFDVIKKEFGSLQIVVNNAGLSTHFTPEELTLEEWNRVIAVNLTGAFLVTKYAIPFLKESGWGRIINVSSLRAFSGSPKGVHYSSAKAGLLGFTRSMALYLAKFNITVNAVAPGYTRTDMTAGYLKTRENEINAKIPLGRVAEPEEIAEVIYFLASEASSYITGEVITANGGVYFT